MSEQQAPFSKRIRREVIRRFLVPALAVLIWTAPSGQGARTPPPSPDELQQQLNELTREKQDVQRKLRAAKRQERKVNQEYDAAKVSVKRAQRWLSNLDDDIRSCEDNLKQVNSALAKSEENLDSHRQALSNRLEIIYQHGDIGMLEMLMQASSYSDLANRFYLLNQLMAQDAALLEQYEEARAEKAETARLAEERRAELDRLKRLAASRHATAIRTKEDTASLKKKVSQEREVWERSLAELEKNSLEVESLLLRLQNNTQQGRESLVKPFVGGFIRPVPGKVTSPYGYRKHPILKVRKMHTGIDFRAGHGSSIKAAASGRVIHSGRWGGYGNCVIIDHGGGMATLYAHCSKLLVSCGDNVLQGSTIARVGSTGLSTGPHLHFEVRKNGKPINPGLQ